MIAFKLVRRMKDGDLAPLFINKRQRFPIDEWIAAECFPTKGFKVRQGFHCTSKPYAPHLTSKGRVWIKCEISDFEDFQRPQAQGGLWYIAQKMKLLKVMNMDEYDSYENCNRCGKDNDCHLLDFINFTPCEVKTVCIHCGLEDYWCYGHFHSNNYL